MDELAYIGDHGADLLMDLAVAALCGAAIGWDRRRRGSPAGVKTFLLVCVGAASYMAVGHALLQDPGQSGDPTRMAGQIVTGIGFLGAGAILRGRSGVTGLTTAASVWQTGAIGVLIGCGMPLSGLTLTVLILVAVHTLGVVERRWFPDPPSPSAEAGPPEGPGVG
jgi:putative Mg2+ transporter-C (MgtC) family protein